MPAEHTSAAGLALSDSHPLSEELSSLRAQVTRFQNEAHTASIKLQRHALDTSAYTERIAQLEAENALLTTELGVLRDNPDPLSSSSSSASGGDTVAELTLSLRRINAKLSLTETALEEHTRALADTTAIATQQTHAAGEAYALAARARGREEEGRLREAALQRALVQAREETRLSDRVVGEYAALVRALEGRSPVVSHFSQAQNGGSGNNGHSRETSTSTSSGSLGQAGSSATLVDPIATAGSPKDALEGAKAQLASLIDTFAEQNTALEARAAALEGERDDAQARLAAANTLTAELGTALARAKFEREQARVDDRSAAGMVERYMKFTQQTTTSLHASLASLRARHAATLSTLHSTISTLSSRLLSSQNQIEKLRGALDEAAGAVVRESVGRRREVGVRVRMVGREERVRRGLGGAVGRVPEKVYMGPGEEHGEGEKEEKEHEGSLRQAEARKALARLVSDVRGVLALLDADVSSPSHSSHSNAPATPHSDHTNTNPDAPDTDAGTEGRMRVLEGAVAMLVEELEGEVSRRVELEREVREREREGGRGGEAREEQVGEPDVDAQGASAEVATGELTQSAGVEAGEAKQSVKGEESALDGQAAVRDVRRDEEEEEKGEQRGENGGILEEGVRDANAPANVEGGTPAPEVEASHADAPQAALHDADEGRAAQDDLVLTQAVDVVSEATGRDVEEASEEELELEGEGLGRGGEVDAEAAEVQEEEEQKVVGGATLVHTTEAEDASESTDTPPIEESSSKTAPAETEVEAEVHPAVAFPHTDASVPPAAERADVESVNIDAYPVPSAPDAFPSSDSGSTAHGPSPSDAPVSFPSSGTTFPSDAAPPTSSDSAPPSAENAPAEERPANASAEEPTPATPTHPLLADLAAASKRYDALQRAFRDCHLALQELRAALVPGAGDLAQAQTQSAQTDVLRSAVERLHDYTEDARVELEIRVADGRVLARGWETIVLLPSNSHSSADGSRDAAAHANGNADVGEAEAEAEADVRRQVAACVARDEQAQAAFQTKLKDVEHDIAVVKRAVYAPPSAPSLTLPLDSAPALISPSPVSPTPKAEGWAAWLGGASGRKTPPSPGYADAPTFGSVMTSPRLRHSASAARLAQKAMMQHGNPFEVLGLRVPMPAYVPQQAQAAPAGRQRTISGVFMLGLGVGHAGQGRRPSGLGVTPPMPRAKGGDEVDVE
ncbi:hypothetical protein B0H19DRAFT_1316555 [Mycena capillaripes]|nr:hypothetical protein B0H19DRAFT_1316555 [Mycena capillaripes]